MSVGWIPGKELIYFSGVILAQIGYTITIGVWLRWFLIYIISQRNWTLTFLL